MPISWNSLVIRYPTWRAFQHVVEIALEKNLFTQLNLKFITPCKHLNIGKYLWIQVLLLFRVVQSYAFIAPYNPPSDSSLEPKVNNNSVTQHWITDKAQCELNSWFKIDERLINVVITELYGDRVIRLFAESPFLSLFQVFICWNLLSRRSLRKSVSERMNVWTINGSGMLLKASENPPEALHIARSYREATANNPNACGWRKTKKDSQRVARWFFCCFRTEF